LARSVLTPDQARGRNASDPYSPEPLGAAKPFIFKGSEADRSGALECLSTAALYEAGDDTDGEAAVAQVVLNRVRHAAFPATICGVVYQGAQRSTGCQFTFTCDGSLRRKMPEPAWRRAREVAERALSGSVARSVGLATHYHTDWVYPYWSPELRKLARVGTQLFFGWPGSWGDTHAFRREYRGGEVMGPSTTSPIHDKVGTFPDDDLGTPKILGLPQPPIQLPASMGKIPLYGNRLRLVRPDGRAFGLLAPHDAVASSLVNAALALCAKPGPCQVNAWSNDDDIPYNYPLSAGAKTTMIFEYVRDNAFEHITPRFDCNRFPNKDAKRCLQHAYQSSKLLRLPAASSNAFHTIPASAPPTLQRRAPSLA